MLFPDHPSAARRLPSQGSGKASGGDGFKLGELSSPLLHPGSPPGRETGLGGHTQGLSGRPPSPRRTTVGVTPAPPGEPSLSGARNQLQLI